MINKGKRQTVKATMPVLRIVKRLRLRNPFRLSVTSFGFFPLPLDVSDTGLVTVAVSRKSGIRYRDRLTSVLLMALCLLLYASSSEAKVTGVCSNCHTMHNSQNGSAVVPEGPQSSLLNRAGCLGCHSATSATTWKDSINNAPIVFNINEPTYGANGLAGGNFYYVSTSVDNTGHNVIDTGNQEDTIPNVAASFPPGDEHSNFNEGLTKTTFTCAGKYGCHGDRTISGSLNAIKGAHHTDDAVLKFGSISEVGQGGSTGLSYRFLKGVKGGEDTDWQQSSTASDHNEYKGATGSGTESTIDTNPSNTISGLCAECHGNYHGPGAGDIGTASPWLRHPTDISLPSSGEYTAYTAYSTIVPVARTTIPSSPGATVTPSGTTDDIIMCLSCHRAHASPDFKMLRWDYKGWPASGGTNGCNVCHTSKN